MLLVYYIGDDSSVLLNRSIGGGQFCQVSFMGTQKILLLFLVLFLKIALSLWRIDLRKIG